MRLLSIAAALILAAAIVSPVAAKGKPHTAAAITSCGTVAASVIADPYGGTAVSVWAFRTDSISATLDFAGDVGLSVYAPDGSLTPQTPSSPGEYTFSGSGLGNWGFYISNSTAVAQNYSLTVCMDVP